MTQDFNDPIRQSETSYLDTFLQTSTKETVKQKMLTSMGKEYNNLIRYFRKKQQKLRDGPIFIKHVFDKVYEVYLYNYEPYAEFSSIFTQYKYDCVTATALYAAVFSDLGINFKIWETRYHTYLMVNSYEEWILLETTDRENGFIRGNEIKNARARYFNEEGEREIDPLHNEISVRHLAGLLCYNQAVKSFNGKEYLKAYRQLQDAEKLYPSERILELKQIITESVMMTLTSSL